MMNQGWECPKCYRCFAPTQMYCLSCNANSVTVTNVKVINLGVSTSLEDMIKASQQLNDWRNHSYLQEAGGNQVAGGYQPDIGLNKGYNR